MRNLNERVRSHSIWVRQHESEDFSQLYNTTQLDTPSHDETISEITYLDRWMPHLRICRLRNQYIELSGLEDASR